MHGGLEVGGGSGWILVHGCEVVCAFREHVLQRWSGALVEIEHKYIGVLKSCTSTNTVHLDRASGPGNRSAQFLMTASRRVEAEKLIIGWLFFIAVVS